MAKLTIDLFKGLIDKATEFALKNDLPATDVCLVLEQKIKEISGSEILWSGTHGTCSWAINEAGVLRIYPSDGISGQFGNYDPETFCTAPWKKYADNIFKIVVEDGVSTYEDASLLFYKMPKCVEMDLRGLDTSNAVDMQKMFYGCKSLVKINFGDFNISRVQKNAYMFYGCDKLTNKYEVEAKFLEPKKTWQPKRKKDDGSIKNIERLDIGWVDNF